MRILPPTYSSSWFGCAGFDKEQGWFFEPEEIREEDSSAFYLQTTRKLPAIIERSDTPSYALWKKNVDIAQGHIHKGYIDKVVLARRTILQLASPVSSWDLLATLSKERDLATTLFLVQRSPLSSFIGATPEKLYERKGIHLRTMALAGTERRSHQKEKDLLLKQQLLDSKKDQSEAAFVHKDLCHILENLCHRFSSSKEPTILKTHHLYHLYYSLEGDLHSSISDRYLLQALHPTAALGGSPRGNALHLIKKLEPFKRGWYGAPLGWFSENEADVAIGIRSCLVQKNEVHLYAGAGIVSGSVAEKEWDELESKLTVILSLWET